MSRLKLPKTVGLSRRPGLPGCVSQGRGEAEAIETIREAVVAWLWAEDQQALLSQPEGKVPVLVSV